MENIVRPNAETRIALMQAVTDSVQSGRGFRICTGEDEKGTWVKWDAGSGWTPPYYSVL